MNKFVQKFKGVDLSFRNYFVVGLVCSEAVCVSQFAVFGGHCLRVSCCKGSLSIG